MAASRPSVVSAKYLILVNDSIIPCSVLNFKMSFCCQDAGGSHHKVSVSPVVHVRGLCESVVEADLVEALEKFGTIWYVKQYKVMSLDELGALFKSLLDLFRYIMIAI